VILSFNFKVTRGCKIRKVNGGDGVRLGLWAESYHGIRMTVIVHCTDGKNGTVYCYGLKYVTITLPRPSRL
jgi:hypothetical protein